MKAKLALLSFGCVVACVFAEVAVRVLHLGPHSNVVFRDNYRLSADPALQYELVPGSVDGDQHISSQGLRDHEYALAKPRGVFRILLIGDSIAYGFGLPQEDAIAKQLEGMLSGYPSAGVSRFEVLNLGVSGYNIDQVVENLRARGLRWQPDLILYAYCLNDPQADSFELDSLKAQLSPAEMSYRDTLVMHGRDLLAKSRLLSLARYAVAALVARSQPTAAGVVDHQWQALAGGGYVDYFAQLYRGADLTRLQRGLAALQGISHDSGVPVVSVVFPVLVDLDHYRLAPLHALLNQAFRAKGIRSYDLLALYQAMFRSHGALFVLNALHPNALGDRLAVRYLLRGMMQDRVLPSLSHAWAPRTEMAELDRLLDEVIASVPPASQAAR
jgi:hypothetical protein